jgi:hypothetical protein
MPSSGSIPEKRGRLSAPCSYAAPFSSLLNIAAGSCFREFFALQRHEVLTEQGKKLPEAAGRISMCHLVQISHFPESVQYSFSEALLN